MRPTPRAHLSVGTAEMVAGGLAVVLVLRERDIVAGPEAGKRAVPLSPIDAMVLGVMLIGEGAKLAGVEISPLEMLQPLRDRGVVIA